MIKRFYFSQVGIVDFTDSTCQKFYMTLVTRNLCKLKFYVVIIREKVFESIEFYILFTRRLRTAP